MSRFHVGLAGGCVAVWIAMGVHAADAPAPPETFPRFAVPGHEAAMKSLRTLFWEHYSRRPGPAATLWDEWTTHSLLWPAEETANPHDSRRERFRRALAGRIMDAEGYVATHQHASIAHQQGWPFPFWAQGGEGAWGWHFSLANVPAGWHATQERTQEGWTPDGAEDHGIADGAWRLRLTRADATVQTPPLDIDVMQAPFLQLRWSAAGLGRAQPYVEWITADTPEFACGRRMYFEPIESAGIVYTMIPMYRHPSWTGRITRLRIGFGNPAAGAEVGIQAFFTQYDTRHNVNNPAFLAGCLNYFYWTRDLDFLRGQIQRMRLALRWLMVDCRGETENCIVTPFPGHDGRSGIERTADGGKILHAGHGVGNNYWDLLPFGRRDAYATMLYYHTLRTTADLERTLARHPEWNVPGGPLRFDPDRLDAHAAEVKAANTQFWAPQTQRFTLGIDDDGRQWDYGFTFMNLEAIAYGYATDEQARAILSWIAGDRIVEGDTAQGSDIYRWRFAPRATTKRNIDYYGWFWNNPESIPWGNQVQDGGAVLGFSYHDLLARLRTLGPDDAWARLKEILTWYDEVQAAGGPRTYYADGTRGTLQGAGTPGGLGIDAEFVESVLVPQIMLYGFAGFEPTAEGCRVHPRLPADWPSLTITRIALHDRVLTLRVSPGEIEFRREGDRPQTPFRVDLPEGFATAVYLNASGDAIRTQTIPAPAAGADVEWGDATTVRFVPAGGLTSSRPFPDNPPDARSRVK